MLPLNPRHQGVIPPSILDTTCLRTLHWLCEGSPVMFLYDCPSSSAIANVSRILQFKLEVEEVDDASSDLARYRHDVSQPLVIQVSSSVYTLHVCVNVEGCPCHAGRRDRVPMVAALLSGVRLLQILQTPDSSSERETIVEQWDMQFDGVPPTHHLRTVSYDDEPTKIYKRMVRIQQPEIFQNCIDFGTTLDAP
jgi:hypothetical protein